MLSKLGLSRIQIGIVFRKLGLFLGSVRKMSLSCILHFFSSHVFIWSNVSRAANIQFCKNPVCKYPVCLGEAFVRVQLFQSTKQVSKKYKAGEVGTVSGTRRRVVHQPDLGRRRRREPQKSGTVKMTKDASTTKMWTNASRINCFRKTFKKNIVYFFPNQKGFGNLLIRFCLQLNQKPVKSCHRPS